MSTLRTMYTELSRAGRFSIEQLAVGHELGFIGVPRFGPMEKGAIVITEITKVDPVEQELLRLRKVLDETRQTHAARLKKRKHEWVDLGVRDLEHPESSATHPKAEPSLSVMVESSSLEGQLQQVHEQYQRGDCEKLTIRGTFGGGVQVTAVLWYPSLTVQAYVIFSGFAESTIEALRGLTDGHANAELETVDWSQHRLVFSTCAFRYRTTRAVIPIEQGTNFLATVAFKPHLDALIRHGSPDRRLDAFGLIPDTDEPFVLQTAPHFELCTPSVRLHDGYLEVRSRLDTIPGDDTDPGDRYLLVTLTLAGLVSIGDDEVVAWAGMPYDHQLLQLHLAGPSVYGPFSADQLDAVMAGGDWRRALPQAYLSSRHGYRVTSYTADIDLPTGGTTAINCTIRMKAVRVGLHGDVTMLFSPLDLTWVVGLPDQATARAAHVSGEGPVVFEHRQQAIEPRFEGTLELTPAPIINASSDAMPGRFLAQLIEALDLHALGVARQLQDRSYPCSLELEDETITLSVVHPDEYVTLWTNL